MDSGGGLTEKTDGQRQVGTAGAQRPKHGPASTGKVSGPEASGRRRGPGRRRPHSWLSLGFPEALGFQSLLQFAGDLLKRISPGLRRQF